MAGTGLAALSLGSHSVASNARAVGQQDGDVVAPVDRMGKMLDDHGWSRPNVAGGTGSIPGSCRRGGGIGDEAFALGFRHPGGMADAPQGERAEPARQDQHVPEEAGRPEALRARPNPPRGRPRRRCPRSTADWTIAAHTPPGRRDHWRGRRRSDRSSRRCHRSRPAAPPGPRSADAGRAGSGRPRWRRRPGSSTPSDSGGRTGRRQSRAAIASTCHRTGPPPSAR